MTHSPVVLGRGREWSPNLLILERPLRPVECVNDVLDALVEHELRDHEAHRREHDWQENTLVAPAHSRFQSTKKNSRIPIDSGLKKMIYYAPLFGLLAQLVRALP